MRRARLALPGESDTFGPSVAGARVQRGCGAVQRSTSLFVLLAEPMGNKGKRGGTNHAQEALQRLLWDGMRYRGSASGGAGQGNWNCTHCATTDNWASRDKCRGCRKPRHGSSTTGEKPQSVARSTKPKVGTNGSGGVRGGGGTGDNRKRGADDDKDDGAHKPARDKGGNADGADGDDSLAAAKSKLAKAEDVLAKLVDLDVPPDDELRKTATARVEAAKRDLDTARDGKPPPAVALLNAERKAAAAAKAERKAKEDVEAANKALREAYAAHVKAIKHREAVDDRVRELQLALARPPGESTKPKQLVDLAEMLGTQLAALPKANEAGNGTLAHDQVVQQFGALCQAMQQVLGLSCVNSMAAPPLLPPPPTVVEAGTTSPSALAAAPAAAAGTTGGDVKNGGSAEEQSTLAAAANTSAQDGRTVPQQQPPSGETPITAAAADPALPPPTAAGPTASQKEEPKEMDVDEYQRQLNEAERRKRIRVGKEPQLEQGTKDLDTAMDDAHGDDL